MNQVWATFKVLTLAYNAHVVDKTTQPLEVIHDLAAKMAGKLDGNSTGFERVLEVAAHPGLHLKA